MCWNASVSLNIYLSYLLHHSHIIMVLLIYLTSYFYKSLIIIQLIEYFKWSKTFSNKLLSQIA